MSIIQVKLATTRPAAPVARRGKRDVVGSTRLPQPRPEPGRQFRQVGDLSRAADRRVNAAVRRYDRVEVTCSGTADEYAAQLTDAAAGG